MANAIAKSKLKINNGNFEICNNCNPKKYLKFNFTFCKEIGNPAKEDAYHFVKRMKFLSEELYAIMIYKYQGNKKTFIEDISTSKIKEIKIPVNFRETHPVETNEKISIFRIYPAGTPNGSANPRIIGMIKHTIFYVFYIDWQGTLYNHN